MRIAWAIPAKFVEVNDGMATIVGGGANIFTLPRAALPTEFGVNVAMQIAGSHDEVGEQHHLRGQILGPDMQPTGEPLDVPGLSFPPGPNKPPGWEATVVIPVVMTWTVEEPGTYTLEFSIDGRSTTTVAILINDA